MDNKYIETRGCNSSAINGILSVILIFAIIIFTITFSIGLPIYVRPFYYAHIEALDMPYYTGVSAEEIREAYDEVLDYLIFPGGEFGAGILSFSEEGASHFADCKKLFTLNLKAALLTRFVEYLPKCPSYIRITVIAVFRFYFVMSHLFFVKHYFQLVFAYNKKFHIVISPFLYHYTEKEEKMIYISF